ncbi:MAG: GGDEF domain-containing protein [Treponema sp.]|nr:GGDEF domain-containing protein [Treponema sp.]
MITFIKNLKLVKKILFVTLFAHILITAISAFYLKDLFLVLQNVLSFIFYAIIEITTKKHEDEKRSIIILFLIMNGLLFQATVSGIYLGWEAGFQNFCFVTIVASFLHYHEEDYKKEQLMKHLLTLGSILVYSFLLIWCNLKSPLRIMSHQNLLVVSQTNAAIAFVVAIFISSIFSKKLKDSMKILKHKADIDELTQLFNRHAIRTHFDSVREDWSIFKTPYAVCILDIDDFKIINDTYGHNIGDDVLKAIGKILKTYSTETTIPCRWGGEEFLIIDQFGSNPEAFISKVNKIRHDISKIKFNYPAKKISFSITVTSGCAFSEPNLPIHQLIDKADNRLYWGKRNGKNQTIYKDN